MNITIFVTDDALQFNLEPENEHERNFMGILKKYCGPAEVHQGISIAESMGHYLRNYDGHNIIAVTIKKKAEPVPNPLTLCAHSKEPYPGALIQTCAECGGKRIT